MNVVVLNFLLYCNIIRLKQVAKFHQTTNSIDVVIDGWHITSCGAYRIQTVTATYTVPECRHCWLSVSGQHSLTLKTTGYTDMFLSFDSRILSTVNAPLSKLKGGGGQNHAATNCPWYITGSNSAQRMYNRPPFRILFSNDINLLAKSSIH